MSGVPVDFIPTADVLLRDPRLAHTADVPVLGIATRFETNSSEVLAIVEEAFGGWRRAVDAPRRARDGEVRVRLVVHEGTEYADGHAPVRHICPDSARLIVHSPGSVAICDPARGEAVAYVSTALVRDRAHFRSGVLEAVTLALLSHGDRHPVHAAAIGRGGRALLLAGPSGTGKSTLAYVARAAGFDVLSDDRVWIQRAPVFRLWGWPDRMRLLPGAAAQFPELAPLTPSVVDGKRKLTVDVGRDVRGSCYSATRVSVCVLERGVGPPRLERVDAGVLTDALSRDLAAGFDRYPARHEAVVRAMAARGGWRLVLSGDPHEALASLERMLEET